MLRILSSAAGKSSERCREAPRKGREDNVRWVERQMETSRGLRRPLQDGRQPTWCLVLGGRGPHDFGLRIAQSHLRHDLTPSSWSHVALLAPESDGLPEKAADLPLLQISLQPKGGFGFPPPSNALQTGRLADYRNRRRWPNIMLLRLPVARLDWQAAPEGDGKQRSLLDSFREQRSVLDATELVLHWLAYLWGVGKTGNPLLEGRGVPAAAMIEVVLAGAGYDLTPGLESRASCPEAIWQAAKWWHRYYEEQQREPVVAAWNVEHRLEPLKEPAPDW